MRRAWAACALVLPLALAAPAHAQDAEPAPEPPVAVEEPAAPEPPAAVEEPAPEPPAASAADEAPAAPSAGAPDPRDADIFGSPAAAREADEEAEAVMGAGEANEMRDAAMFGPAGAEDVWEAESRDEALLGEQAGRVSLDESAAPNDPLTIGGLVYLRLQSFILEGDAAKDWSVSVPTLTQVYFDVRPNERVRAFMQVRLQFDPTLPPKPELRVGSGAALAPGGASDGVQTLSSVLETPSREVRFAFDQLWINFDIAYRAFVTVGKIHDRWGTGRFWMPTDYLHLSNRNPINVFDSRTGTNMLKLHVPIESLAWNFYAYAVTEAPLDATDAWGKVAGAFRGEFVMGPAELGLGIFGRSGELPRLAADLSFGVWDFDFYGELAVRDASVVDRVRYDPNATVPPPGMPPSYERPDETALYFLQDAVDARYPVYQQEGMKTQVVGGLTYSAKYDDDDVLTLGFEYFFNDLGYADPSVYPGLVVPHSTPLSNPATFFYLGQHYLAGFLMLPSPFALDLHRFTLSTLGNLSDRSYLTRLDYAYTLLTHLTLEAFFAVHYGQRKGEFRFGTDPLVAAGQTLIPAQPPSLVDVGLALRLEY